MQFLMGSAGLESQQRPLSNFSEFLIILGTTILGRLSASRRLSKGSRTILATGSESGVVRYCAGLA